MGMLCIRNAMLRCMSRLTFASWWIPNGKVTITNLIVLFLLLLLQQTWSLLNGLELLWLRLWTTWGGQCLFGGWLWTIVLDVLLLICWRLVLQLLKTEGKRKWNQTETTNSISSMLVKWPMTVTINTMEKLMKCIDDRNDNRYQYEYEHEQLIYRRCEVRGNHNAHHVWSLISNKTTKKKK